MHCDEWNVTKTFPRREAGDVWCPPPVWNLRAVIWFPIPISCLLFFLLLFLSCHFSANGPFSWLFSRKLSNVFQKGFCFVEQLGDDSWLVVCAACCHMALAFAIMHLYNLLFIYIFFKLFLSTHFFTFFFNLVWINKMEWSMTPVCPSLMCSFNRGNIEGTNSSKICVWCLWVCFMFVKWLVL